MQGGPRNRKLYPPDRSISSGSDHLCENATMLGSMRHTWLLLSATIAIMVSCKHEENGDNTDADLLEIARNTDGYVWYKEDDMLLPRSAGSGHSQAFLRTRFSPIAATVLDTNGKVLPDTTFPNGSVIVKELYENTTTLSLYALLYKKPDHPYADASGWVWGYVKPNGDVQVSARERGAPCRSCHGQSGNIDLSLMNAYFP